MNKPGEEPELLPDELVWADGGHASDVVLTAMADGQLDILPRAVRSHVDGCNACTRHLGNAALLSLHAGRELAMAARLGEVRAPLPRLAIVLGLGSAVLGLLPTLVDSPSLLGGARSFATHDLPMLAGGLGTLGRRLLDPGSPIGVTLTYGAAALLAGMAFVLVRWLPKKEESR
jgi:hypothetical protein